MSSPSDAPPLRWSTSLAVQAQPAKHLTGDKILLPASALEQLLAASTVNVPAETGGPRPFDPYNPYSLAAARAEQSRWLEARQQLPHPLTFRLVNPANGNVVYAGIREFSAEEGLIGLSPFLREALDVRWGESGSKPSARFVRGGSDGYVANVHGDETASTQEELPDRLLATLPRVTIHAQQVPRGTNVRLRPLEAGYNPDDWKALLERQLREHYTTLTKGEILMVHGPNKSDQYRFLVDYVTPDGDAICVVDTDLEVDIEALNEEQARETMKSIMTAGRGPHMPGSSGSNDLDMWKPFQGQIMPGEYVDLRIPSWDRASTLEIELEANEANDLELFISPFSSRYRTRPREDDHVWATFDCSKTKQIIIQPSSVFLENAEALYVSVHAPVLERGSPHFFKVHLNLHPAGTLPMENGTRVTTNGSTTVHSEDESQCKNCLQWIPKASMKLHENFCLRNNILCPQCHNVFQKRSPAWKNHWHCPHDAEHGDTPDGRAHHDRISHSPRTCSSCDYQAANLLELAQHRTSVCPGKLILCQFCHLEVAQEGDPMNPSPEMLLSGLTAHELADGARTTECHLCSRIVRLLDMTTHLKHHELEKKTRARPAICRNANCGRTLHGITKTGEPASTSNRTAVAGQPVNDLGLCGICFGPLYVSMHDPQGKALRRRIERRYLSQLVGGCGKPWCRNPHCRTAQQKQNQTQRSGDVTEVATRGSVSAAAVLTTKDALPLVAPLMLAVPDAADVDGQGKSEGSPPSFFFCTDESSQARRLLAEMLAAEGDFDLEWCVAACEVEAGRIDGVRTWLGNWAPRKKGGRT